MATIINNPRGNDGSSDGMVSLVIGVVLLIMIVALFFLYALPAIQNANQAPEAEQGGAIDVNVVMPASDGAQTETQTQ
jgi:hypothetical protein